MNCVNICTRESSHHAPGMGFLELSENKILIAQEGRWEKEEQVKSSGATSVLFHSWLLVKGQGLFPVFLFFFLILLGAELMFLWKQYINCCDLHSVFVDDG